jgi:hypothetical protein
MLKCRQPERGGELQVRIAAQGMGDAVLTYISVLGLVVDAT